MRKVLVKAGVGSHMQMNALETQQINLIDWLIDRSIYRSSESSDDIAQKKP